MVHAMAVAWNAIILWQSESRTISVIDGFHDIVMHELVRNKGVKNHLIY